MRRPFWNTLMLVILAAVSASAQGIEHTVGQFPTIAESDKRFLSNTICSSEPSPRIIEIREADPAIDLAHHKTMRDLLVKEIAVPNTTVVLGPNVVLDFSDAPDNDLPLSFGRCTTLTSASSFPSGKPPTRPIGVRPPTAIAKRIGPGDVIDFGDLEAELERLKPPIEQARTPRSLGPLLKFGKSRSKTERVFLDISCLQPDPANPRQPVNDGVRISGFRLFGPSFGQQSTEEVGIHVYRCLDIEISNMEIAGWGGAGISITDDPAQGPGQEPTTNLPGDRIGRPDQVRVFNNYIHHNQHPSEVDYSWWDLLPPVLVYDLIFSRHAAGYGVDVGHGAWAQITENLFDFNRHAIAASGDTGGYNARRNLVLKGGGYHYGGFHTHQFDIHGMGDNGFGGQAAVQTWYSQNAFQYRKGNAIKIRGRPDLAAYIFDNIFPHAGLEDDWGDDAIHLATNQNVYIGPGNVIDSDTYGKYGVCDFDGDGVDDLFLATGVSWWFSSGGEFPWSFLSAQTNGLKQVRFGYFDNDQRCDVLAEQNERWEISSGGRGRWYSIGAYGAPLTEVAFGQFDPNIRDHRPGVTRRTTHAFQRAANAQWYVTPLTGPNWQPVGSSSKPMNQLRFGDFTGDGVTDVLAVESGRWAISESAIGSWRPLNSRLSDNVGTLFIADLDNNNVDDIIRLESRGNASSVRLEWWVSDDGTSDWRPLKSYDFLIPFGQTNIPLFALTGRFGSAPGAGVLIADFWRIGQFYSSAETAVGALPNWKSLFAY